MKESELQLKRTELQNRLNKLLEELNLKQDFLPYISRTQFMIFNEFLSKNNRSSSYICGGLGLSATTVIKECEKIIEIAQNQLSRKQQIEYLIKHYGGNESLNSLANAMPEPHRNILLNYMLVLNPNSEEIKKAVGITYDVIDNFEYEVFDLLEKMYPKKLEIDNIINESGGRDFIFNNYANTLNENQHEILVNYTLSYLPQKISQLSKSLKISENEIISENELLIENLNKIIRVNKNLSEALQNPKLSGYRLKIPADKLRKVLSAMPTIHQEFAEAYFGDKKSLNQISRETKLSLGSISSRKIHFYQIFYELSQKNEDELIANYNSKSYKTAQRYSNISTTLVPYIKKLASFEPEINPSTLEGKKQLFAKYLYPFISEDQIKILEENILTPSGKSADTLAQELGDTNYQYIYSTESSICSKLNYIIDKQIEINKLYEKFGGKEELEDLSKLITDVQKIVLNNYYLSLDPNSNSKTLKLLNRAETGKNGFGSIREGLMEKLDDLQKRKKDCQAFISENGGIEFLQKFAEILSEEHKFIFNKTMIDYHYTSLRDVSLNLGKFEQYAIKAQKFICEKLSTVLQKEAWAENVTDKLGELGINKFAKKLSDRDQKILFEYTLNCFAISLTDFCNSTGEKYKYTSKTIKEQTEKLNELVKEKDLYYRGY